MILEGTQMLCTVLNQNGVETPYKSTHTKHPCTLWAGRSLSNWTWLSKLTLQLNEEFLYRYRKSIDHESASVARELSPPPLPDIGLTEFAQAMPEAYKVPGNPVQAYRNFYVGEKWRFATWTRRRPPKWFTEAIRSKVQKPRSGDASRERLTRTVMFLTKNQIERSLFVLANKNNYVL
jgi:hypothetical protein